MRARPAPVIIHFMDLPGKSADFTTGIHLKINLTHIIYDNKVRSRAA